MSETLQGGQPKVGKVAGAGGDPLRPGQTTDRAAPDLASTASDVATDIAGKAAETGRQLYESAKDQATGYADQRKDQAAQSISDIAQSIRETGKSFEERPNIRAFVDSAANGLEQLSGTIRDRSFSDIYADVESFARQRPWALGAASMVAGFMLSRFIKSSSEELSRGNAARSARREPAGASRSHNAVEA